MALIVDRAKRAAARTSDRLAADPGLGVEAFVTAAVVVLGTALILSTLQPSDLFSDSTPTGGDMGSHLWGPRYLIDHLLPNARLSGWTPDWYSGFPAYQFYMVVPSLIVVLLHVGLPGLLAVPAALAAIVLATAGWAHERLYRYRWVLLGAGALTLLLVVPISYNRAFKLTTVLGLLSLPLACWVLAKAAELPFPIPPIAAAAGVLFLYNREPLYNSTGNIIGGNFQSTMAGEFAFSVSLSLAVLYLAVAVRGLRTGRHRALAALLFALAGLCHLIPAFFVLGCTGALFLLHPDRARFRWLATMVPVAGLLTAFWVVPFWWRRDYVNDMGWERLPIPNGQESSLTYYLVPDGLRFVMLFAVLGLVASIIRRWSVGMVLGLAWVGVAVAFSVLPQARLWNARLLPFMYLAISLLAAIGIGELLRVAGAAASGDVRRPLRVLTVGGAAVICLGVLVHVALPITNLLPGLISREAATEGGVAVTRSSLGPFSTTAVNPALGWSGNNYSGLEGKAAQPAGCDQPGSQVACTSGGWEEYRALVQTMAGIGESEEFGCGRAFWEYDNPRLSGYGTPMALMMLPYFTDSCIGSQEGLYFESSTTVPHHFLMQAELSASPSSPQRELPYPGFDMDAGVRHLQMLGVRYYLAVSPTAVEAAGRHPDLTEIAVSGPWHVYEVADADLVVPLAYEPVVATGIDQSQHGWLPSAAAWFLDPSQHDVPIAATGPSGWERVELEPVPDDARRLVRWARDQLGQSGPMDQIPELPRTELPTVEVTDVEAGQDSLRFRVSEPGVPVLVRTSYFPNWQAEGAEGPYRVTPNLMVVVPTDTEVTLTFGRTPVDLVAAGMTLLGLVGLVLLARARPIEVEPERPTRLSLAIDRALTIERPAPPADQATAVEGPGGDPGTDGPDPDARPDPGGPADRASPDADPSVEHEPSSDPTATGAGPGADLPPGPVTEPGARLRRRPEDDVPR